MQINTPNVMPHVADSKLAGGATLAIVIPTFNERMNVEELLRLVELALIGISWEVIFVDDDSPDGTSDFVRSIAIKDSRVRCIQRLGRRGLSSACVEGILATSAPFIAVMDADLQHDERLLPRMLECLLKESLDIVVGSRYVEGGGLRDWPVHRLKISKFATTLGRAVIRTDLKDPMSGFFLMRREAFVKSSRRLSNIGFKILLDIFASSPTPLRFRELPYEFRARFAGDSKLDTVAMWDYGMLLLDKLIGHWIPVRFVMFSVIGALGLIVHLIVLAAMLNMGRITFAMAQAAATIVAMTANFFLNNYLTYRDKRLRGARLMRGLFTFYVVCGLGAAANIGVASYAFEKNYSWWLAGIVGVIIGAVWNYAATSVFTWRDT
jgi:dolichol-phosphate mannosyltransferase